MDCKPTTGRVLDYGMRWGIEALFSDMKTKGFGITKTQLKEATRIGNAWTTQLGDFSHFVEFQSIQLIRKIKGPKKISRKLAESELSRHSIERLMLILALATYWAVSTGMAPTEHKTQPSKKKQKEASSPSSNKG